MVTADSEVRLIDAFVDCCDLESLELREKGSSQEGRPAISNADLLKLYLYAYLNRTRSSRQIARLCKLNIEVQWLLKGLKHQFGTIKRGWGYTYTLMKGKPKIEGEFNLIYTVYNIRRAITILGVKKLIEMLKAASISIFCRNPSHFKPHSGIQIFCIGQQAVNKMENSGA